MFNGVNINKLEGGLGRRNPSEDNVMALVVGMPTATTTMQYGNAYELYQVSDVESLGVNEAFDSNNSLLVYSEVKEFFTYCPDGVLYLIPVATGLSYSAIVSDTNFLSALSQADKAKVIGIRGATDTITGIATAVASVQAFVNAKKQEHRYIDAVILEGVGETGLSVSDYPDLTNENAPNVAVSIAQDPFISESDEPYHYYASVGAVLGMLGVRQVNENLGSVDILNKPNQFKGRQDYPLTIIGNERWNAANLSIKIPFSELSKADIDTLNNKGYIFAGSFDGYGGVFFSNSPTCVAKSSDFSTIENNRVWNKAVRIIRQTLIPKVKGIVKRDPQTGFIKSSTISSWQALLNKAMEQMIVDNEISGFDFYIDPKQVLGESSPLVVKGKIVSDGIVFEFEVDLGLNDKL